MLAFTGSKWVAFADPVKQTGWLIDLKIASPYVMTGKQHKIRKVVNSGTMLCSYVRETKKHRRRGSTGQIKKRDKKEQYQTGGPNNEFSIGPGLPPSTVLLEIILGDQPDDFVDVLLGFKLRWPKQHANKRVGLYVIAREAPKVEITLSGIQKRVDRRELDIKKILLGPFSLERLRYTHGELAPEDIAVILNE